MQFVSVYLPTFWSNSFLKCASQSESAKNTPKRLIFEGGSRSFKVINVDISKKLATNVCYDKQHVCANLQPFSLQTSY